MAKLFFTLLAASLLMVLGLSGCASTAPEVTARLDLETGATVTVAKVPLQFVYDMPAYGAHARQHVQLGVIEVNRSGDYRYFIWLGSWSSSPDINAIERRDELEGVTLFADGEPVTLSLTGWLPGDVGLSEPAYSRPRTETIDAYYRVTPDIVGLIAESRDLTLLTGGARQRRFELWDAQTAARKELQHFAQTVLPAP